MADPLSAVQRQRSGFWPIWRSLRREWQQWVRESPYRPIASRLLLVGVGLGSGALLLVAYADRLMAAATLRGDTERGLLELRINGHRVVAADWGHWDPIHRYVARPDRRIIERELITSSIVRDGQQLRLTRLDGQLLYDSLTDLPSPALLPSDRPRLEACLRNQTNLLGRLPTSQRLQTWGFYCPLRTTAILGAATSVTDSGSHRPPNGWLIHYSSLQRPSYNPAINHIFAALPPKLALLRPSISPLPDGVLNRQGIPFLNELASRGSASTNSHAAHLGLHQRLALAQLPRDLLLQVLLPWLMILIALICLPASLLLMLRSLRRNQRLERRRLLRRLREERRLEPGSGLIGRAEWLERLEQRLSPGGVAGGQRLALLGVRIQTFQATLHDGARARQRAQQLLVRLLREEGADRQFAFSPENHLLMAYRTDASLSVESEEAQLRELLEAAERSLAETMQVRLSALITPLGPTIGEAPPAPGRGLEPLVADLDLLQTMALPKRPVQFLGGEDRRRAAALRRQISSDFDCNRLAANLQDHRYRPEAVHHLPVEAGDGRAGNQLEYTELLFRLPEGLESGLSIQELILSLERNGGVHLIDTLMLRKAISLTREVEGPRPLLATNLSATTLQSLEHRCAILSLLRATPADVRRHLALEVTETSVIADLDAWDGFLQELRQLGLKVVIDDFGTGYASLAYLFRFNADFIKVDRQFSQRLHDPDVEAMVDFLLHYERHHGTGIVMEGIETVHQLHYWQQRGLRRFQGFLFTPPAGPEHLSSLVTDAASAAIRAQLHPWGAAQRRQSSSAMRAV